MAEVIDGSSVEEKVDEFKVVNGAKVLWPADMPEEMLLSVLTVAQSALADANFSEREGARIAEKIKRTLDKEFDQHWHVSLGTSFGSHAVHEKNRFCYFYIGPVAFMIYKAGSG
jgi:dynein light chain LC8-type